ncbi:MAG: HAD family hydrolase [Candidatus Methanomethylophilaceae archaeon]
MDRMTRIEPVLRHEPDTGRRFVAFDMFNTIVRMVHGKKETEVFMKFYADRMSDRPIADVKRAFYGHVTELMIERSPENMEVTFEEVASLTASDFGVTIDVPYEEVERSVLVDGGFVVSMEGAEDTLRFFRDNGYRVAVLSNSYFKGSTLIGLLEKLGLYRYVDLLISSADIGYMKPRREAFDILAERMGADNGDVYFVGDDPVNDYTGSVSAGMRPIHIDLKGRPMGVSVGSISEIPSLFVD